MTTTRFATGLLALLLACTGFAAAAPSAHGDASLVSDAASAAGALDYADGAYAADALAAADDAAAGLSLDGGHSDVEAAADGSWWSWVQLRFSALADSLRSALGLETGPVAVDGYVGAIAADDRVGAETDLAVPGFGGLHGGALVTKDGEVRSELGGDVAVSGDALVGGLPG